MKIFDFGGRAHIRNASDRLYKAAVDQARSADFYAAGGVPDTVEGRFEMIALHVYLVLRRLRGTESQTRRLSQYVFDAMFDDMDRNLREMGTGDLSVGRKVKGLAKQFYGRVRSYDQGLAGEAGELEGALRRNLFAESQVADEWIHAIAAYVHQAEGAFRDQDEEALLAGEIEFPAPPSIAIQKA